MGDSSPPSGLPSPAGAKLLPIRDEEFVRWRVIGGGPGRGSATVEQALITDDSGRFRRLSVADLPQQLSGLRRLGLVRTGRVERLEAARRFLVPQVVAQEIVVERLESYVGEWAPQLVLGAPWARRISELETLLAQVRGGRDDTWIETSSQL